MPNQRPPAPPPLAGYRPASERPPAPGVRRGPPPPPMRGGRPPEPPQRRRRSGLLSALLYTFVFVLVVVGGGAGYLILNPPSDLIRETLAAQVKDKTGRDLVVSGGAAFSFYPGLGVTLKNVSLSGPAGSPAKLVTMDELVVNIKTMPLLNRQIEVRRLILKKPVFDLRVDKAGGKNWSFAQAALPVRYAQADTQQSDAPQAPPTATDAVPEPPAPEAVPKSRGIRLPQKLSEIDHLELDDVRIENGTLRYTDERSGKSQ
ncbi:MAG: AsmA family protein, partial [Hyphomicrobium sp.]